MGTPSREHQSCRSSQVANAARAFYDVNKHRYEVILAYRQLALVKTGHARDENEDPADKARYTYT